MDTYFDRSVVDPLDPLSNVVGPLRVFIPFYVTFHMFPVKV